MKQPPPAHPEPGFPSPLVLAQGTAHAARGEAYRALTPEWHAHLERAAREGTVEGATALKAPHVWRAGDWVFKFYAARGRAGPRLRDHRALRTARAHARILPVASPEPLAALAFARTANGCDGLLVSRFVAGRTLGDVWRSPRVPEEGREALARFLAAMDAHRVRHGDLHPGNLLWDGTTWWLLDLDGLRPPALPGLDHRLERDSWARLYFNLRLDPKFAEVHRQSLLEAGREAEAPAQWARIERRARAILASRKSDPWPEVGPEPGP